VRTGPSPFELDSAKKGPPPPPRPEEKFTGGDLEWREKLHGALMELEMAFTADAVEHSEFTYANGELQVRTPKDLSLGMTQDDLVKAVKHLGLPVPRIKITFGEVAAAAQMSPQLAQKTKANEDEVTRTALANPEVQRFREVFGGEVRTVRNLKE
jgi:hypothetical protein